jgi:hypothetical protein
LPNPLQTGVGGMMVCAVMITIAQHVLKNSENKSIGIFLILATLVFVIFFTTGPGAIAWLITGELFAHNSRLGVFF